MKGDIPMLGIIIKDYYESFCLKKNLIGLTFSLICFITIIICMHNQYAYILLVGLTLPMIGVSTLQYSMEQDEISKYDQILLTFPLTKKEIVKAKMLATLSFTTLSNILINIPIFFIYVFIYKSIDLELELIVIFTGYILSYSLNAINSIGFFILGNKKGSIMYIILMVLLAFGYVISNFAFDLTSILTLGSTKLLIIGAALAIILNIFSYHACIKIYTRKHS